MAIPSRRERMATPVLRADAAPPAGAVKRERRALFGRQPALRLLTAERSEEILPILLDEIVQLGYPRSFVMTVDFETGQIQMAASVNCPQKYQKKFNTMLWATEDPLVGILKSGETGVLPNHAASRRPLFCYPMVYRSRARCWEAERSRFAECLAV